MIHDLADDVRYSLVTEFKRYAAQYTVVKVEQVSPI